MQGTFSSLRVCGNDGVETPVAEILHIGLPRPLAPGAGPLGYRDAVGCEDFAVNFRRRLFGGKHTGDVEIIPVADVADGELLNKSSHRSGHAVVRHARNSKQRYEHSTVGRRIARWGAAKRAVANEDWSQIRWKAVGK